MYANFETVDWVQDAERENQVRLYRQQRYLGETVEMKLIRAYSACQSWLVLASAGVIIGVIAVFITVVTGFLNDLREGHCSSLWYLNKDLCCNGAEHCADWVEWPLNYFVYVTVSALLAAIACLLVLRISPFAAGSGISELKCIVAGFVMKGFLGLSTLTIKSVALPLTIAAGISVGKEGPSVHYAACVGNVVGRLFIKYRQHNSKRTELLTACTAAGVAVAFGSPIGGVLFSLEEISSTWDLTTFWRSYFCCLVATSTLSMLDPYRNGKMVLFSVRYDHDWHWFEMPVFVVLGVFGGVMGHLIIKYNLKYQAFRKRVLKDWPLQEVVALAVLGASVCYFNQFLKVDMTKSMAILFHECGHGWEHESCEISNWFGVAVSLFAAFVIRTLLVLVSYGAKVPCGIFVPSLAIGALFGRFLGTFVWKFQSSFSGSVLFSSCPSDSICVDPGTYAFLGAAALLSGVMHLSITVVIVMFEITGALKFIIPLMIVVGITTLIAGLLDHGGIADQAIIVNGFPFFMEEFEFEGQADEIMVEPTSIELYGPMPSPLKHRSYPIVDHEGFLVGVVDSVELSEPQDRFDMEKYTVNESPCVVSPDTSLEWIQNIFTKIGPRAVFVLNKGLLVGMVTRKDMLRWYQTHHQVNVAPSVYEEPVAQMLQKLHLQVKTTWESIFGR